MSSISPEPLLSTQNQSTPSEVGDIASFDGSSIHYEIRGRGPVLLISNNFFMTCENWRPFTHQICKKFTVINYDLRHQGASGRVDGEIALEDHVCDLVTLVEELGLERFQLLGTCVSTLFCLEYALRTTDKIEGLIMVGPILNPYGGAFRKYLHRSILASLRHGGPAGVFDHYYPLLYTPRSIQNNKTAGYLALKARFVANNPHEQLEKHLHSAVNAQENPERLREIQCPVLYLAGESDFLADETSLRMLAELTPRGRYQQLELAGHNPYVDSTAAFEEAVIAFASEHANTNHVA